jgi:two-component system, NarL family, nitrate/nitrite response regulator NarL
VVRALAALSARDREIIGLVGQGLRNQDVADRVGVAEKTVRNQLSTIFDKLGVNDRLGLVLYALQHGLLAPPT